MGYLQGVFFILPEMKLQFLRILLTDFNKLGLIRLILAWNFLWESNGILAICTAVLLALKALATFSPK